MAAWSCGVAALFFAAAGDSSVVGGTVREISWDREISHARTAAGAITWEGPLARWRAPDLCSPARISIHLSASDGSEVRQDFDVTPGSPPRGIIEVVPSGADAYELQLVSDDPSSFAGSVGTIDGSPHMESCHRARWRLPEARRPDWAVAAAFDASGALRSWRALPRPTPRVPEIEAPPGTRVVILIANQPFSGVAQSDGLARVPVHIPPGVRVAQVVARNRVIPYDLATPSPTSDHRVEAPDGSRWIFRVDARGAPDDGEVPPASSVRVSMGAYRIGAPYLEGSAGLLAPIPQPEGAPRSSAWRLGIGAHLGPTTRKGAGASVGRSWRVGAVDLGGGFAALFSGRRHIREDGAGTIQHMVWAGALWGEAALPARLGSARGSLAPGIGWAAAQRLTSIEGGPNEPREWSGPLLTLAIRAGVGPIDAEVRALGSTAPLRPDASQLGWLMGFSWVSTRAR